MFGDGSMARDFTHVNDIVRGVVHAMRETEGFRVLNLGNSSPCTVKALIEKLGQALAIEPRVSAVDRPPGEMDVTFADITRAGELWGWRPVIGPRRRLARVRRLDQGRGRGRSKSLTLTFAADCNLARAARYPCATAQLAQSHDSAFLYASRISS